MKSGCKGLIGGGGVAVSAWAVGAEVSLSPPLVSHRGMREIAKAILVPGLASNKQYPQLGF